MTQQERQERSRNEIAQAAMEEFGSYSYDKVTMERICSGHGISKGMMYHYYSSKDELFLLCVQITFDTLKNYVEEHTAALNGRNTAGAIRDYFMIREQFFQCHPKESNIFENAMLRPPVHLQNQIWLLHRPIQEMNRQFLEHVVANMALRPGLSQERVAWYLERVESAIWSVTRQYQAEQKGGGLRTMLETMQDVLDMVLVGIVRQTE